jgi:serine phosphatase RsbU (regulator of sigma subunit)
MNRAWRAIEELATISDDAAMRRRFDDRNRFWLRILLIFFGIFSIFQMVDHAHRKSLLQVAAGALNLAVIAAVVFALAVPSLRSWTGRRTPAITIGYIAVQYVLALSYSTQWRGWTVALPLLMLGFRMTAIELVLVHGFLASGGVMMRFIIPPADHPDQVIVAVLAVNLVTLAVNLHFSRRMSKEVVGEFGERRRHAREQIRMRDELRYARQLQLSMLPERAPELTWADISSASVPATEVGGDYYDYFVEGDCVALVCGDVAGHGMAAGLVLSSLRTGFTLLRDSLHDPAAVLRRLHDLIVETNRRRMLVTVSVVLIDHAAGSATIASAGHPPVLLRRADGVVESINLFATPLGVRLPVHIPQRTIDVASGDTLVLHSDGIYETRSPAGEDYGLERLEEVVRTQGGAGSAEELRDAILRDVAAFRGSDDAVDDVTVVVCRVL